MSYYYQIGGDISNNDKASKPENWRTADFSRISKNQCINVKQIGNMKKAGTKSMDRDDNEAMFIPQGYAVLGYDHDNCESTGQGVQFYHGYHTSNAANQDSVNHVKAITGNKRGGIYNYKGPDSGGNEDQPRNIAKKMSSWKVFDLNTGEGLGGVLQAIDEVDSSAQGVVSSNKRAYQKYLCERVDKNTFDKTVTDDDIDRKFAFEEVCENILTKNEIKRVWPEEVVEDTDPIVEDNDPIVEDNDPIVEDTYPTVDDTYPTVQETNPELSNNWDSIEEPDQTETNWLLYGGIAASVSCFLVFVIIAVIVMRKKKISNNV